MSIQKDGRYRDEKAPSHDRNCPEQGTDLQKAVCKLKAMFKIQEDV
jgi:hypothetical protein